VLRVSDLKVAYGKTPAVRGISLHVESGELVSLVGPNGAGKTTLASAVVGLIAPAAGSIEFEGRTITGQPPEEIVRRGLSLVPEGRHIFQRLTVAENLSLGSAGRKYDAARRDEVLDLFPVLRKYFKSGAGMLSGGEQQQLAIARALVASPKLLVLDEPSLGLAPLVVDDVFEILNRLRETGTTVLLIEQNAKRAVAMADRSYVLTNGVVVAEGTPEAILGLHDMTAVYLGQAVRSGDS